MDNVSILLLMSDEVERLRVEQIFRLVGHEVISASTVDEASAQLVAEPIDLFICEHDPREKDRIALLTATKWRLPYLARLLLAAQDDSRMAQRALETGIVHFTLVPPVSQTVLLDTAQAMLQWAQEQRLGTPASKTGRNSAARRQHRETLDDDHAWELELEPQSGHHSAQDQDQDRNQDRNHDQDHEPEQKEEVTPLVSSAGRGRVEWYY